MDESIEECYYRLKEAEITRDVVAILQVTAKPSGKHFTGRGGDGGKNCPKNEQFALNRTFLL